MSITAHVHVPQGGFTDPKVNSEFMDMLVYEMAKYIDGGLTRLDIAEIDVLLHRYDEGSSRTKALVTIEMTDEPNPVRDAGIKENLDRLAKAMVERIMRNLKYRVGMGIDDGGAMNGKPLIRCVYNGTSVTSKE